MAWNRPEYRERVAAVLAAWREAMRASVAEAVSRYGLDDAGFSTDDWITLIVAANEGMILERLSGIEQGHAELLASIDGWREAPGPRFELRGADARDGMLADEVGEPAGAEHREVGLGRRDEDVGGDGRGRDAVLLQRQAVEHTARRAAPSIAIVTVESPGAKPRVVWNGGQGLRSSRAHRFPLGIGVGLLETLSEGPDGVAAPCCALPMMYVRAKAGSPRSRRPRGSVRPSDCRPSPDLERGRDVEDLRAGAGPEAPRQDAVSCAR
jgi:hypothetical protein